MAQPTEDPLWSTDANYTAGADPWDGTATRVAPTSGRIAQGMEPNELFPAQWFNWAAGVHGDWIQALRYGGPGYEYSLRDEFTPYETGVWGALPAGATAPLDNAAGGFGAVQFAADVTNPTPNVTRGIGNVGTKDFYLLARSRCSVFANANSNAQVFLSATTPSTVFAGFTGPGAGVWTGVYAGGPSSASLGITVNATYRFLEALKIGTDLFFYVDGVLKSHITAFTSDFGNATLTLGASRTSGTGLTHQCDLIEFWTKRVV